MSRRPPSSSASAPRARLAALLLATSSLLATGCSSFAVEVAPVKPVDTQKSVVSLFVVVGSEKDLARAEGLPDALELVQPQELSKYESMLQFTPLVNAAGGLEWRLVNNPHGNRVHYGLAPLRIKLDSEIVDETPDTCVLLIAQFKDGVRKSKLLDKGKIATKKTFAFDVRDGELKPQ